MMKQATIAAAMGLTFAGCATAQEMDHSKMDHSKMSHSAAPAKMTPVEGSIFATLQGRDGANLGTVEMAEGPHGIWLKADLQNMPQGVHAFHIHQTGVCTGDFTSAGGHLNPTNKKHGFMAADGYHLGDMPNIHVPASGNLTFEYFLPTLKADMLFDADGSTIMVHEGADDYVSDPAGNAGPRIACGVLTRQQQ